MNRKILDLAIPNIISNITVPLLGIADLMIVGRLGEFKLIAAIGVATAIFNLIYWNISFLRMGTSGFTAQYYGARDLKECTAVLVRGVAVALAIAFLFLIIQKPLSDAALWILNSSDENQVLALQYFNVRIWAAPATISLYVFNGWFIGMQNAKTPMFMAIVMNLCNILFSYLFAIVLKMGIAGVALGTLISQYIGAAFAVVVIATRYKKLLKYVTLSTLTALDKMKLFSRVNRDIFIRTVCMSSVFTFFTSASSLGGEMVLATNTLLLQLFILFSYFMDGFAYAAEALVGRYVGANNSEMVSKMVRQLNIWGVAMAALFMSLYFFGFDSILALFSDSSEVLSVAHGYKWWIVVMPLCSFMAFLYDGIMGGATLATYIRNSMLIATAVFFIIYFALNSMALESALWSAFLFYLSARGVSQAIIFEKWRRKQKDKIVIVY